MSGLNFGTMGRRSVTFVERMRPGVRGLGNASPLGTWIKYVVSPETGEILGIYSIK